MRESGVNERNKGAQVRLDWLQSFLFFFLIFINFSEHYFFSLLNPYFSSLYSPVLNKSL